MQLIVSKERQVERLHQEKMYLTSEVKKLEKQKSELLDIDEDSMGFGDLW
jgi:cell division protein FtsB